MRISNLIGAFLCITLAFSCSMFKGKKKDSRGGNSNAAGEEFDPDAVSEKGSTDTSPQKGAPGDPTASPGEPVPGAMLIPESRTLRTANQYRSAAAKALQILPSYFDDSSLNASKRFEVLKDSLAKTTSISQQTAHSGLWSAAINIASSGCSEYLKDENADKAALLDQLGSRVFVETAVEQAFRSESATLTSGLEENDSYQLQCMLMVSSLVFY